MAKRKQSPFEYLQSLQLEHTVFTIRLKIYPGERDIKIFTDLLEKKEAVIRDIAERNFLPHIFNDDIVRESFRSQVVKPIGFPNFHYDVVSPKFRTMYEKMDPVFYYYKNNEFRFMLNGENVIGIMKHRDTVKNVAKMNVNGETVEVDCTQITRIM